MRKASIILAAVVTLSVPALSASGAGAQQKGATPEEVVQKVKQAASYLAKEKEAGLATFKQKQSEYVWADTYVFVVDCVQKKNAANPINPKLNGMDLASIKDLTFRESLTLFPLAALTILFGVYPKPVLDMSAASVQQLVNNYNTAVAAVKAAALLQ